MSLKNIKSLSADLLVEFIAVLIGFTIAIEYDKRQELSEKSKFKTQSFNRLLENIQNDQLDCSENIFIHETAVNSCKRLITSHEYLYNNHKDSLGYFLSVISTAESHFMANEQEYIMLRNSGYLEKVKNNSLIRKIQEKYTYHSFIKTLEKKISSLNYDISSIYFKHVSTKPLGNTIIGATFSKYNSESTLNTYEINLIQRRLEYTISLLKQFKLIKTINSEIIEDLKAEKLQTKPTKVTVN